MFYLQQKFQELYFDPISWIGKNNQVLIGITLTDFLLEACNDTDTKLLSFTVYKEVLYTVHINGSQFPFCMC